MPHDIRIGAPRDLGAPPQPGLDSAPALLQRSDDDFLDATLQQLRSAEGRQALRALLASATNAQGVRKLFQPVQRQFHLALAELWCETHGTPRVDPARIESAGLVVRRVRRDAQGRELLEGWMKARGRLQGWVPVERLGPAQAEPRAALRLPQPGVGVAANAAIGHELRRFALEREESLLDEQFTPVFLAPPEVCAEAKKTLLYAVVQTTSSEIAAVPAAPEQAFGDGFGADDPEFVQHLVEPLRGQGMEFTLAGETVRPQWFEAAEAGGAQAPDGLPAAHWAVLRADPGRLGMRRFTLLLRQLAVEFDAFGDSPGGRAVFAALQQVQLPLLPRPQPDGRVLQRSVPAGEFLRGAYRVLIEQDLSSGAPEMPRSWPAASAADGLRLRQKLAAALRERFVALKGAPGRYDDIGASYRLRLFVRLKPEPGTEGYCRGHTLWSGYSEPFVIAPWYEGGGAPPVQVALPDPTDRAFLRSLKPNVAFVVPPSLQNLVGGNPKELMEGKGSTQGLALQWICGFNIPLTTICAFVVLSIFFSLLNLVFWWLPFLKVCIPFPKRSGGNG